MLVKGSRESNCNVSLESDNVLSANNEDLVNILASLGETEINISHINMNNTELGGSITTDEPSTSRATLTDEGRLGGFFCSKTVFNLSHKILTETEIKVLEKGLDFAPVQRTLNEPKLRKDFEEFCRRMRCKWHFRNEVSGTFSEIPAFRPKSNWSPPKGHASLEIFLSQMEKELFTDDLDEPSQSNLSPEEWKTLRNLAPDRSIVIKGADKGSSVVVWDRADYILEAEEHLNDKRIYKEVKFNENILTGLVEKSNKIFNRLCSHRMISESELKYLTYNFKKATNLGKLYFLPKIHKRLANVPGRPFISNCGTPTEKVSEYLDFLLKLVMQDGWSYVKDTGDFLKKIKRLRKIPESAILVTANVVGLYPNITHHLSLQSLRKRLNETGICKVHTEEIISMAEFVLQNNYFEFNEKVCRQVSGTAIGTTFVPPYACIFMYEMETSFLKTQQLQPFI